MVIDHEDSSLDGMMRLLRNVCRRHSLPAWPNWKDARHGRSLRRIRCNVKRSADHTCTIVHDVKSHALSVATILTDACAVVSDQQRAPAIFGGQLDLDFASLTMLD